MAREWVLELESKTESKRDIVCQTVLDLRAKGSPARLCPKCAGTGETLLPRPFRECRTCAGLGYL
jgi:DnaJ-class molecular chaperone